MTPSTPNDPGDGATSSGSNSPDKRRIDKTKRARWATRRMTVKSSGLKRLSLVGRNSRKPVTSEKKRQSGGSETLQSSHLANDDEQPEAEAAQEEQDHGPGPRQLYFNLPLPKDLVDESGSPIQHFTRNKIRTAKYTPLSFIPKNLWFQFQNIANIFFLFLVILVVSIPPSGVRAGLPAAVPSPPLTSFSSSPSLAVPTPA